MTVLLSVCTFTLALTAGAKTLCWTANQIAACTPCVTNTHAHVTITCIWMRAKTQWPHPQINGLSSWWFLLFPVCIFFCICACIVFMLCWWILHVILALVILHKLPGHVATTYTSPPPLVWCNFRWSWFLIFYHSLVSPELGCELLNFFLWYTGGRHV